MLMVLMSFFVLFYSADESKSKDVLKAITVSLVGQGSGEGGGAGGKAGALHALSGTPGADGVPANSQEAGKSIMQHLIDAGVDVSASKSPDAIEIKLPDNVFRKRQYKPNKDVRRTIEAIVDVLKPHADAIDVVFIGHTDSSKVVSNEDQHLADNYDLSSLRAVYALKYAISAGYPSPHLFAKAASWNDRETRSISIEVSRHKE